MYEELANILLYDAGWLEQGITQTERDIAEHLKKATDAIEELSKPKWIPMTERLPEEKTWVLVFIREEDKAFIAVTMRTDFNYWSGLGRERNITHWMPLPEPPKEKKS